MSDRETKKVMVGTHEVEFRTYLTGKEDNKLRSILMGGVFSSGEKGEKLQFPVEKVVEQEESFLSIVVAGLDGNVNDPVAALGNLPKAEYREIVDTLKKELDFQVPKTSDTGGTSTSA